MQNFDLVEAFEEGWLVVWPREQLQLIPNAAAAVRLPLNDQGEFSIPRSKPAFIGLLLKDVEVEEVPVQTMQILTDRSGVGQADGEALAFSALQFLGKRGLKKKEKEGINNKFKVLRWYDVCICSLYNDLVVRTRRCYVTEYSTDN